MEIGKYHKLHLVCAKEMGRYAMHHIRVVSVEDGKAKVAATNGRAVVELTVEASESDAPGFLTVESWKAAMKPGKLIATEKAEVAWPEGTITEFGRPSEGEFPDYAKFVGRAGGQKVTFNARYLWEVAQALGRDEVTLTLPNPDSNGKISSAIDVVSTGVSGRATLMPITVDA